MLTSSKFWARSAMDAHRPGELRPGGGAAPGREALAQRPTESPWQLSPCLQQPTRPHEPAACLRDNLMPLEKLSEPRSLVGPNVTATEGPCSLTSSFLFPFL